MNNRPRPTCGKCGQRPRAISYYRQNGVAQYRSICEHCLALSKKLKPPVPRWQSAGYVKKKKCDVCGFTSQYSSQITVWHVDGNANNTDFVNLRSICLCCVEVVKRRNTIWRRGDLEADY